MAGRPRTMLKRIHSWMQRAEDLHEEIIAHMPGQYKNPHPAEWELPSKPDPDKNDPVACQWTACDRAGFALAATLMFLEGAIVERTGVFVPFTSKPDDEPDEPEVIDTGETSDS